jgi:hypothetical protein
MYMIAYHPTIHYPIDDAELFSSNAWMQERVTLPRVRSAQKAP